MNPDVPVPPFSALGLSEPALAAVAAAGYTVPTPVQVQAIPPLLAGRDVIAIAATGTGKTAAFVLPILDRLAAKPVAAPVPVRALVLAPTRELVQQIAEAVRTFGAARGFKCAHVVGGVGFDQQILSLRSGREILVATPGRLIDHLQQRTARLDAVEFLILDEADRMLDMGFMPQIDRVLRSVPEVRQTMLFSATMGDEVERFARRCLRDPVRIQTVRSGTVAALAEQRVFHVPIQGKMALLEALLVQVPGTTLVFTRTKVRAERIAKALRKSGHPAARIHGDRSQSQRNAALDAFKSGEARVLVATDVAARGLDIDDVAHVINFDLSRVADDHVHRVGRTARAGASGLASSFCAPEELELLREIEKLTRNALPVGQVPDGVPASEIPAPEAKPRPPVPRAHAPRSRSSRPSHDRVRPFVAPEDRPGGGRGHGPRTPGHGSRHAPRSGTHASHDDGRRTDRVPSSESRRTGDTSHGTTDRGAAHPHAGTPGHRPHPRSPEHRPGGHPSQGHGTGAHPPGRTRPDDRPSHGSTHSPTRAPRDDSSRRPPGGGSSRPSGGPYRPHPGGARRGPFRPGGSGPRRPRHEG